MLVSGMWMRGVRPILIELSHLMGEGNVCVSLWMRIIREMGHGRDWEGDGWGAWPSALRCDRPVTAVSGMT